jgi:hypothetical protein
MAWGGKLGALSVSGLLIGSAVAACGGASHATSPGTSPGRTTVSTTRIPPTAAVSAPPGALRSAFGDGTWTVGTDITPGTYTTQTASNCHWDVEGDSGGGQHGNVASATSSGQVTVVVSSTDKTFTSSGCGTWSR